MSIVRIIATATTVFFLFCCGLAAGQDVQFSGRATIWPRGKEPFPASSSNTKIVVTHQQNADPIVELYPDQTGCWRGTLPAQPAIYVDALWVLAGPPTYLTEGPVQLQSKTFTEGCSSATPGIRLYQTERLSDEIRAKARSRADALLTSPPFSECGGGGKSVAGILNCWAIPSNKIQLEGRRQQIDQIVSSFERADRLHSFDNAKFSYAAFSTAIGDVCKAQDLFAQIDSPHEFASPFAGTVEVYRFETGFYCLSQKTKDIEFESNQFRAQLASVLSQDAMWSLFADYKRARARLLHVWLLSFRIGESKTASAPADIARGVLKDASSIASWEEFHSAAIRHLGQVVGPRPLDAQKVAEQVHLFLYNLNK